MMLQKLYPATTAPPFLCIVSPGPSFPALLARAAS
jgi:hypothetical protein